MSADIQNTVAFQGPIPASIDAGRPFGGAPSPVGLVETPIEELLPPFGYVEEEYFVSGAVTGVPYATTLLIRRPADLTRWSGILALEAVHVQGALGFWQTCHDAIMDGGHAWAAVGSQRTGLEGPIKAFDPARYVALEVPATIESEQVGNALDTWAQGDNAKVPVDLFAIDKVSNAILTQTGAALKTGAANGPFGKRPVAWLVMGGASQTGVATLNYIKNTHAAARMPDGSPVYDGFLPMAAPGWEPIVGGDAAVIQIFAEGDLALFSSIGAQGFLAARADSDDPGDRFRCYQIAGASHLPTRGLADLRDLAPFGIVLEPEERFTQFPTGPFYQGAFVRLIDWIRDGTIPAQAPPINVAQGEVVRDEAGNATGGLRSPYVDVPTARYVAARYVRNLIGVDILFSSERLQELYPSRADYIGRFNRGIDSLVASGWILPHDGKRLKREEAARPPL